MRKKGFCWINRFQHQRKNRISANSCLSTIKLEGQKLVATITVTRDMAQALKIAKEAHELSNSMLKQTPITEMGTAQLDRLQQALDIESKTLAKLGGLTYDAALNQGYRFNE